MAFRPVLREVSVNKVLHISGSVLRQGSEPLRQILLDHTGSDGAARKILFELIRLPFDRVSHCVVHPVSARHGSADAWEVRVVYTGATEAAETGTYTIPV